MRDELVHRGADFDIGGGLLHLKAAEHVHLWIVTAFTFHGGRIPQALEHANVLLQRLQRRERFHELHASRALRGAPVMRINAVAGKAHGEASRCGVVLDRFCSEGADRFKPRQPKGDTGAMEKFATRKVHKGNAVIY